MATYKDDLDIIKAAEKADTNKLTFNAITKLDNKGLLGRYGGEGGGGSEEEFSALFEIYEQEETNESSVRLVYGNFDYVFDDLTSGEERTIVKPIVVIEKRNKPYTSVSVSDVFALPGDNVLNQFEEDVVSMLMPTAGTEVYIVWTRSGDAFFYEPEPEPVDPGNGQNQ